MPDPLHVETRGRVRVLRMDRPPANATGLALRKALAIGLVDAVLDEPFLESAVAYATSFALRARPAPLLDREDSAEATAAALRCLESSLRASLAEGLRMEEEEVSKLITSPQSRARREAFFAARR